MSKRFVSFKYSNQTGVSLWRIHRNKINNPDEVVVENDFRVVIDFPFRFPRLFIFNADNEEYYSNSIDFDVISAFPHITGFTRDKVLNILSRTYKNIYKEEKATMTNISPTSEINMSPTRIPILPTSNIQKNKRIETNGIYGIHSYDLIDLKINGMIYVPSYDYWKLFVEGE